MNAQDLKLYIYENDMITQILEELGMHHIKWHDNKKYITCGMPDGDNKQSTVIYNNEFLNVTAYTRDIVDENDISDIISLVSFIKKYSFRETIFWLSNKLGLGEE